MIDRIATYVYQIEDAVGQSHIFWFAFGWGIAAYVYN